MSLEKIMKCKLPEHRKAIKLSYMQKAVKYIASFITKATLFSDITCNKSLEN